MEDLRRGMFKENGVKQFDRSSIRRNLHKEQRKNKRNDFFQTMRNMEDHCIVASTPFMKSQNHIEDKENEGEHEISTNNHAQEKIAKKKAYLERFLSWKAEKEKRMLEERQKQKPQPFMPWGKPKEPKPLKKTDAVEPFVFESKQFELPANFTNLAEKVRRQSIYVFVPTPPKQKANELKSIKKSRSSTLPELRKHEIFAITKPKETPLDFENIEPIASTKSKVTEKVKNAESWHKVSNKSTTTELTLNPKMPNGTKNLGAIPKQPHQSTEQLSNKKESSLKEKPFKKPFNSGAQPKQQQKVLLTNGNHAAINQNPATTTTTVSKSHTTRGGVNKVKMPPPKDNVRAKLTVNLKAKKPVKNLTNKNVANGIKSKFTKVNCGANLVNEKQFPLITPTDCNNDEIFTFVTSTQSKSLHSNNSREFSQLAKTISPIVPKQKNCSGQTKPPQNTKRKFNFVVNKKLETTLNATLQANKSIKATKPQVSTDTRALTAQTTQAREKSPESNRNQNKNELKRGAGKFKFIKTTKLDETVIASPAHGSRKSSPPTAVEETSKNSVVHLKNKKLSTSQLAQIVDTNTTLKTVSNPTTSPENVEMMSAQEKDNHQPEINIPKAPLNYVSSFVSVSRGKVSAKKEREKRNSIYLQETPHELKNKEEVLLEKQETPIEKRRALEAVRFFRKQLSDEIERLHEICDKWETYKDDASKLLKVDENSGCVDMIDVAIGQTKLLTSKKFKQFSGLIDRCEAHANGTAAVDDGSEGTKTITPIDIEGFWSMLGLQVDNIDKRFENLERWKANAWEDPDEKVALLKPRIKANKVEKNNKAVQSKNSKPRANTALIEKMREMREAMANAKKNENVCIPQIIEPIQECRVVVPSPRRLRRSTLNKNDVTPRTSLSNNDRISVVVRDRRFFSLKPTVISISSPDNVQSPLKLKTKEQRRSITNLKDIRNIHNSTNMLKSAILGGRRRSRSCTMQTEVREASLSPVPSKGIIERTPSPIMKGNVNQNGWRSILKTPGSSRVQQRNITFSEHLSVKKFEQWKYTEEEKVHINDYVKTNLKFDNEAPSGEEEVPGSTPRTYSLRNRKVNLRPSSEFEIPR